MVYYCIDSNFSLYITPTLGVYNIEHNMHSMNVWLNIVYSGYPDWLCGNMYKRYLTLLQGSRDGNTEFDWKKSLLTLKFLGSCEESDGRVWSSFELWIRKWVLKTAPFCKLIVLTWLHCPARIFSGRLYSDDPLHSSTKGQEEEG